MYFFFFFHINSAESRIYLFSLLAEFKNKLKSLTYALAIFETSFYMTIYEIDFTLFSTYYTAYLPLSVLFNAYFATYQFTSSISHPAHVRGYDYLSSI